jgi:hypothetical protein
MGSVALAFAALTLSLLTAGCSQTMDNNGQSGSRPDPPTLDVDQARDKTKAASSEIYEMITIRNGKATTPGPGISTCDEDPDHLYKTRHFWSIYNTSEDELKAGFQRLRQQLPKNGWKIVEYGPDKSPARSLSLTADSTKDRFSVHAVLMVSTPTNPHEKNPLLAVTVVSGCWRAPKGTDLNTVY